MDSLLTSVETKCHRNRSGCFGQKRRLRQLQAFQIPTTQRFARYGQGCRCTVRSDLIAKIKEIVAEDRADHVLSNPTERRLNIVGKTFTVANKDGYRLVLWRCSND